MQLSKPKLVVWAGLWKVESPAKWRFAWVRFLTASCGEPEYTGLRRESLDTASKTAENYQIGTTYVEKNVIISWNYLRIRYKIDFFLYLLFARAGENIW